MRHESASNAAEESTKECWSIGPEEVHSRQPCGRPDAKPDCKEQGYRNGMSHVDTLAGAWSSRVLHLHPAPAPAALVAAVGALRYDAFEAHGAGVRNIASRPRLVNLLLTITGRAFAQQRKAR